MTDTLPLTVAGEDCILAIHATPRARHNAIEGVETDAAGLHWLRVRLTAAPEDGKANKALVKLLSKQWKIPASRFTLISGDTARYKRVRINESYLQVAHRLVGLRDM